ncbi:MAG: 2-oxoisovalerate dehydrogenase [Armatimonadetes bacterium]|nr:2-oxoisovalerate dehydrogenase [Armatimonadota bacterium]
MSQVPTEILFVVEEDATGGYTARAIGAAIFTEADTWSELQEQVRDSVQCHFEPGRAPKLIRLHYVREEVLPL